MQNNLINPNQSGLRPGDSIINQLLAITTEIYNSFEKLDETRAVFLNISKAFDKVWHHVLLFRLKQNVIGKVTREDHSQIMNTMVRFYSEAKDAEQKMAMAFELSDFDHQLLKFGGFFRERFMDINVSINLEDALDLCWQTLAECFESEQLLMKNELVLKYFPTNIGAEKTDGAATA